ncbi:unnamed protein product, partial [Bubo scandiacus]
MFFGMLRGYVRGGKPAQVTAERLHPRHQPGGVSICCVWWTDGTMVTVHEPAWVVQTD